MEDRVDISTLTPIGGYYVDYTAKYYGSLIDAPEVIRYGWKVYDKNGEYAGILDENKIAFWHVDPASLKRWR